jgi:hypothetical protein
MSSFSSVAGGGLSSVSYEYGVASDVTNTGDGAATNMGEEKPGGGDVDEAAEA